jgi:multiple sugar transport system permease protein
MRRLRGQLRSTIKLQKGLFVWFSLVPIFGYMVFFSVYPIVSALDVSLRRWRFTEPGAHPFVGLKNYAWALADDIFWTSVKNTLVFTVGHVAFELVVALVLAVIIYRWREPWKSIGTVAYYLPVVCTASAMAMVFRQLLSHVTGPVNYLLSFVGLGPYNYFLTSGWAMASAIGLTNWRNFGVWLVLYLAGLTTIPGELMEAAEIDGANRIQGFFRITLPLLRPTITYLFVLGTIATLQGFTEIFVLTGGGPGTATRTLVIHIYEHAFTFFNMGRGSAVAFLLFLLTLSVAVVQMRALRQQFEY